MDEEIYFTIISNKTASFLLLPVPPGLIPQLITKKWQRK